MGAVENGRRVTVDFAGYKGRAGMMQTPRGTEIAFRGTVTAKMPTFALIDGERAEVIKIAASETVDGMTVLTVRQS